MGMIYKSPEVSMMSCMFTSLLNITIYGATSINWEKQSLYIQLASRDSQSNKLAGRKQMIEHEDSTHNIWDNNNTYILLPSFNTYFSIFDRNYSCVEIKNLHK